MEEILLSIVMTTYNHGEYIKQALDSIFMQKVNFKYEIIVGDDCSQDNTLEILLKYKEEYGGVLRLFIRKVNMGSHHNHYDLIAKTRGKYISYLEGDDFWNNDMKLQKQMDFLETHEEYIAVVHKINVVDRKGNVYKNRDFEIQYCTKEIYSLKEFETGILAGHTSSLMFRNIYKNENVDYSFFVKFNNMSGDSTLMMLLAIYGNIFCMNEIMSCYRKVIDKDSDSFSAMQESVNRRDEYYQTQVFLEDYTKNVMYKKVDFTKRKKNIYVSAVFKFMRQKNRKNFKVVLNIIKLSKQPIYYTAFAVRIIIVKMYYKVRYHEDRRVNF